MGFLQRTAKLSARAVRAGLTPSLVSYFFWIGGITSIFGAWTFISYTPIEEFLCNIPGEVNITNGWTVGCGNCSDTLMLCDKSDCWRHAFNLSWQLDAATPNGQYYDAFQEAALDSTCNSLAMSADSPVGMLSNILDRRLNTGKPQVSESCVTWNCRVLARAFMRSLGSHLTGPGTCTNENPSVKSPWQASECTCDAIPVAMAQATSFRTLCGSMATGLRNAVYQRHLSNKDACFQGSMAASATAHPIELGAFSVDTNCESVFESSLSTMGWFANKNYILANIPVPTDFPIQSACRKVMCTAFVATLSLPECNFTTNTQLNTDTTSTVLTAIAAECQNEGLTLTPQSMCAEPSFNESAYCDSLAGGRRLDDGTDTESLPSLELELLRQAVQDESADRKRNLTEVQERAEADHFRRPPSHPVQAVVGFDGVEVFASETDDDLRECGGNFCSSERRLQTVVATPAPPPLQEYTTTPWSTCTCYMQCVPGVRTRSVSCPAGVTCQEPKPSAAQSCVCKHCSDCDILLFVLATAGAYLFTGVVSFLLWLGFVAVAQLEEDDYTEMSIGLKCLGCFCKFLPIITKLMTYITMLLIILLVVTALVPIGEPFSDCKGNQTLTVLAIGGVLVWLVQLLVGVYMHRFKPMPPWLHSASSGAMKFLLKPLNAVGP
ncbi:unnamed protein product [Effrenium voratum]|uniref:Transmembrane protein n=1 Tax=Effrenium voratum TaxID=2562239 RepID=A0AA36JPD0_9DINO|nr:unnamed protein product [Effrenium voratum]CAJ1408714.1 unnamed protein product [Effrenium voratum]CAJ1455168.1 unnamed protein product [Effrenium voratum]|mmetsp:Transcript_70031/g.167279  ORF Transcript_70031/g.167279 Transcript_70031/m.167279 type:complete len:665 (-) Transcript_70031:14-2008(-)